MSADKTNASGNFSDFEKKAMMERARELKAEQKASKKRELGEAALHEAIAAMPQSDREIAEGIHKIVCETTPELWPKTWYGMPAYANEEGKVVFFFQGAEKFEARYATFGFNDTALLDDGNVWPTAYAIKKLSDNEEKMIAQLLKRAVGKTD